MDRTIDDVKSLSTSKSILPNLAADGLTQRVIAALGLLSLLALQISPLFWGVPFYLDWINHAWGINYYISHLLHFGNFPITIDVTRGFGNPAPMYYGIYFYPLFSLLGLPIGGDLIMRVLCAALLIAPLLTFTALFFSIKRHLALAILLSIAVNASVYQLTNLYARSAITEFAAYQLLLIATSLIFYGLFGTSALRKAGLLLGAACAAIAFGSHPVTVYMFSLFASPLLLLSTIELFRLMNGRQFLYALLGGVSCFLLLLPWILNTLQYMGDFRIGGSLDVLIAFPLSIDSIAGRIGLFYTDARVAGQALERVSTPYLDAPFPIGLAMTVAAVLVCMARRDSRAIWRFCAPCVLVIALLVYLSIPPEPADGHTAVAFKPEDGLLYRLLLPMQFLYRIVGTISLCLAIVLTAGLVSLSWRLKSQDAMPIIVAAWIGALISLIGVGQKFGVTYEEFLRYPAERWAAAKGVSAAPGEGFVTNRARYGKTIEDVGNYPKSAYGWGDYAMTRLYPRASESDLQDREVVPLRVREWDREYVVQCSRVCIVRTNILASKFNKVTADSPLEGNIRISNLDNLVLLLDIGTHRIQVEQAGSRVTLVLTSIWIALSWFLGSVLVFIGALLHRAFSAGGRSRSRRYA